MTAMKTQRQPDPKRQTRQAVKRQTRAAETAKRFADQRLKREMFNMWYGGRWAIATA